MPREAIAGRAAEYFEAVFGRAAEFVAVSPGRINIIGEHLDYAGGLSLPAAIDRHTGVAVGPRVSGTRVTSEAFAGGPLEFDTLPGAPTGGWADHLLGTLQQVAALEVPVALDVAVVSDVPAGSGLSSSAAVSVATAMAALGLAGRTVHPYDMARLAQRSENRFLGVPSGLMDQVACVMGRQDMALLFHADTEIVEGVPLPADAAWLVCQSGVKRSLRETGYADRRDEAERALEIARRQRPGLQHLCSLEPEEASRLVLPPPLDRRVRHLAGENQRVRLAVACIEAGNLDALGELILTSHRSLARDYEVSLPDLDHLVDIMMEAGCTGARVMGAGFGGSILGLVRADAADEAVAVIAERFRPPGPGQPAEAYIHRVHVVRGAAP